MSEKKNEKFEKKIMIIGSKESFLIQVLVKKLKAAGIDSFYVPTQIHELEGAWDDADTIVYYLDNNERIESKVMQYLKDTLRYTGKRLALIGEKADSEELNRFMEGLVWNTFLRPLDTERFINALLQTDSIYNNVNRQRTILIVDDDPTYMDIIRSWLKDYYQVGMASSGLQALQWLGMNAPDLILLDYEMPVSDGPQVFKMLKSDPDISNIPVFFLTSRNDKETVMQVMALKPENYLLKTIERTELLEKLDAFFRSH